MKSSTAWRILGPAAALGLAVTPATAWAEDREEIQLGITYTADLLANAAGGLSRGTAWVARADVTLEAKGDSIGLPGATLFVDLIYTHGPDFSGRRVGDAQVVSNVQGDGVFRPYEAYVSFPIGERLSGKAGLIDLNTEFDVQTVGSFFTNSSHGIGPDFSQSGINGPSIFPVTSSAVMLHWRDDSWSARAGLFNAVAGNPDRPHNFGLDFPGEDGSLLVAEAGLDLTQTLRGQLGGWLYTVEHDVIGSAERERAKGSKGAYAQLEALVAGSQSGSRLDAWVRLGAASGNTNRITSYAGGGLTYGTDATRIGIAVAHARQSARAARAFAPDEGPQARAETNVELGYSRQVTENLTVQPVVQYVKNPGWRSALTDALVVGVRVSFSLAE